MLECLTVTVHGNQFHQDLVSGWMICVFGPHQMSVYPNGVSVLMPGERIPTFMAHPAPVPCPPEPVSQPIYTWSQHISCLCIKLNTGGIWGIPLNGTHSSERKESQKSYTIGTWQISRCASQWTFLWAFFFCCVYNRDKLMEWEFRCIYDLYRIMFLYRCCVRTEWAHYVITATMLKSYHNSRTSDFNFCKPGSHFLQLEVGGI